MERIDVLGGSLARLAQEQIAIRRQVEERWLEDLERYMGQYDAKTLSRLKSTNSSQAFVNITRAKTAAAESRLADMLFPSDDKNWGIQPTPVPELIKMRGDDRIMVMDGMPMADAEGRPVTYSQYAEMMEMEARERSRSMEKEIDDQLTEAHYHGVARDMLHYACLLGTGILKGPIVTARMRKSWNQLADGVHILDMAKEFRPGVEHVKPWDFFPDMAATKLEEASFVFERRYITKKQLIELAKRPGYLVDQIRKVISDSPKQISSSGDTHIAKIRELSGLSVNLDDNRYELWEYHGPIDKDDLEACGCEAQEDELSEVDAVVVFVNNTVIKAQLNPLETNERIYSVFCYEEDDTSIFGFGVPYLVRHEQRIANAAWRMMLDNAALGTGPQIIVNRELVEPSDGSWDLKARKIWWLIDPTAQVQNVFASYEVSTHQDELMAIYEMARNMVDDVTSLPMLAQGEQGDAPETATGMSMLMNSANVVLRRIVKSFDDDITRPLIGRFYDWNMQNSDKEGIKGDFEVDARGSSTLMVKETQAQALVSLMQISQTSPFAELTKHAELYRKMVQAQHLTPDEIVKTNEEIEAQPPQQGPSDNEIKLQIAQMQQQTEMLRIMTEKEITAEELQGKLEQIQLKAIYDRRQERYLAGNRQAS